MNKDRNIPNSLDSASDVAAPKRDQVLKCDEIQDVLLDYMSRQLGDARSVIVREHLRKCDNCRAEAAEMQSTLDLLRQASKEEPGLPDHLTDDRRKRIVRAIMHPIIDWMDRHHNLISIVVAIIVLAVVLAVLRIPRKEEDLGPSIPIWKYFKSGDLPALVEKARREAEEKEIGEQKSGVTTSVSSEDLSAEGGLVQPESKKSDDG